MQYNILYGVLYCKSLLYLI